MLSAVESGENGRCNLNIMAYCGAIIADVRPFLKSKISVKQPFDAHAIASTTPDLREDQSGSHEAQNRTSLGSARAAQTLGMLPKCPFRYRADMLLSSIRFPPSRKH